VRSSPVSHGDNPHGAHRPAMKAAHAELARPPPALLRASICGPVLHARVFLPTSMLLPPASDKGIPLRYK
jgi:hypothetical protein